MIGREKLYIPPSEGETTFSPLPTVAIVLMRMTGLRARGTALDGEKSITLTEEEFYRWRREPGKGSDKRLLTFVRQGYELTYLEDPSLEKRL